MSMDDGKLYTGSEDLGKSKDAQPAPSSATRAGGSALIGGVLGDLLQAILGADRPPAGPAAEKAKSSGLEGSGSGPGGILSSVLGELSSELNLPPDAARAVITFVAEKLFASRLRRAVGGAAEVGDQDQFQPGAYEVELDGLLEKAGSGEGVSQDDLRATALPSELAAKSGLDLETVIKALQMVMNVLAGKEVRPSARPSTKKKPKKSTAKKTAAKKPVAKKSTAKKTTAKKTTAKKSTAKKTTAKKTAAKKSTAKKTTAKKTTAKKSTAKKTTAKKSAAKSSSKAAAKPKATGADKPSSAQFETKI